MRIWFFWKWGAWKSTFAAAMTRFIQQKFPDKTIIAMDGDINMHLGMYLGIWPVKMLHPLMKEISDYVFWQRDDILCDHFIASTPPHRLSNFIHCTSDDTFLQKFADFKKNIALLSVGTFREEEVWKACFHGKLNAFDYIYNHLLDTNDDIVISDCMAWIDNLWTANYFVHDISIYVIEPTIQSIQVYKDYQAATRNTWLHHKVIINKVTDIQDKAFVLQHIDETTILWWIKHSESLRRFNQWSFEALDDFVTENTALFTNIHNQAVSLWKNRDVYLDRLQQTYISKCDIRYNDYHNSTLYNHTDKTFTYTDVIPWI